MTGGHAPDGVDEGVGAEGEVSPGLRLAAAWTWRLVVIAAGVYLLMVALHRVQVLVVPLLVALLLSALTTPMVSLLDRHRLPRSLAVATTMVTGLVVVGGLFTLVGTQLASGLTDLGRQATQGFGEVQKWLSEGPLNLGTAQIDQYLAEVRDRLSANSEQIVSGALAATATAGELVTGALLTLFALAFFLYEGERIWTWLTSLFPGTARVRVDTAARAGWQTLTAYVRATIIVATADAVGIGVGAALLGVPLAIPLAVLVFLGAFVPIVGALLSGSVAVLVALVALGPVQALIMLAIVVGVQQVESHVLQPFVLGRAVSVHPLAVVLAIGTGLIVAGIVGALFAVPLVAVGNTVVHSLQGTKDTSVAEFRRPGLRRPQLKVDLRRHPDRGRRRSPRAEGAAPADVAGAGGEPASGRGPTAD